MWSHDKASRAGHPPGCNLKNKKKCLVKALQQRNLPWCKTWVMKKLHYMAVLFQMFHGGIIRNRISKILMSVSLQVTLNCLCHGSSVRTQHISEEQLDTKQLHETSVAVLPRSARKPSGVKHKFQNLIRFDTWWTGTICLDQRGNKFGYFYRASIRISWSSQDVFFTACENALSHHRCRGDIWGSNHWCWPIIIPGQSPECLEKHKYYHHGFTFNQAGPDSFIHQPISDLLLELRCPHLDGCWGEIRLMAINGEDGNSDEAFHLFR